jgi:hypothetical protein
MFDASHTSHINKTMTDSSRALQLNESLAMSRIYRQINGNTMPPGWRRRHSHRNPRMWRRAPLPGRQIWKMVADLAKEA